MSCCALLCCALLTQVGTLGVDYKLKTMTINEEEVSVQVWDTAGQVRCVLFLLLLLYFRDGVWWWWCCWCLA